MTFTVEQKAALEAKLDRSAIKERDGGGGKKLSYIEGWWAISEANRIFGFDDWTRETISMACVFSATNERGGFVCTYIAKVRIVVDGVVREGTGAGHGNDKQPGQAHEKAVKEAETDAMKRALMTFGNPFGLALYDKLQEGVDDGQPAPAPQLPSVAPQPPFTAAAIPVQPTDSGASDWKAWAQALNAMIKAAPSKDAIAALMKANEAPLATLKEANAKTEQFLQTAAANRFPNAA